MSYPSPLIGFDRYIELGWCRASFEVAIEASTPEELHELVAETLAGRESQRKTIDILKRISTKPFPHLSDFITRGKEIYRDLGPPSVLPLAWGGAIASYQFFGKTAETAGRLLALQGDCSTKEIQRRMAEAYGDRNGIERAVARVLQSLASWDVLKRDDVGKRMFSIPSKTIDNDGLTIWLIEAALRYAGKPVSVPNLQSLPVLFPFTLSRPLVYLISNSHNLALRSEGASNQFVTLRVTFEEP